MKDSQLNLKPQPRVSNEVLARTIFFHHDKQAMSETVQSTIMSNDCISRNFTDDLVRKRLETGALWNLYRSYENVHILS